MTNNLDKAVCFAFLTANAMQNTSFKNILDISPQYLEEKFNQILYSEKPECVLHPCVRESFTEYKQKWNIK